MRWTYDRLKELIKSEYYIRMKYEQKVLEEEPNIMATIIAKITCTSRELLICKFEETRSGDNRENDGSSGQCS